MSLKSVGVRVRVRDVGMSEKVASFCTSELSAFVIIGHKCSKKIMYGISATNAEFKNKMHHRIARCYIHILSKTIMTFMK